MAPQDSQFTVARVSTPSEWEMARAIRAEVFVQEQGVPPEEEWDELDDNARHWLLFTEDGLAVGTARAVEKTDEIWKIGRFAIRQAYRKKGAGTALLQQILRHGVSRGVSVFKLDSQVHAQGFYSRMGFEAVGPVFMDCSIPHRHMVLTLQS
ncbi:MAG: GNAT family N-acetyltransferase [Candidatus Sericytochromatia bacterium]|nr:GNAT family N-acetyltransferase [Candidatus Sericytochromatia bacterium]